MGRKAGSTVRTLSIRLLGPPEIFFGEAPISPLPSRKTFALLVYLAVESSRIHERHALASLLWPDAPEERGLASLRQSLLSLRRVLGTGPAPPIHLEINSRSVRFNPGAPHRLDVSLLESPPPECRVLEEPESCDRCARHLSEVAEAIRGSFLEGFTLPDCEEFENWAEGVRARVKTQTNLIVERLIRFRMREGDLSGSIWIADRGLRIDPLDERGHRRLMRLFAESGDRRAVELQFEACRNLLARELGIPPDPETLDLLKEIREGRTGWEKVPADPVESAELCPVTTLFFDGLSDPGGRDGLTGPELRSLCDRVPEFIRTRGGVPVRSHGGTILAWYGLGRHREGAARRAARTALELADLFKREASATVRAGLHAGMATVELPAVPDSSEDVVRVAMSLCMQAENGELIVSRAALPLLANQFRVEPSSGRVPPGSGGIFRLLGIADNPRPEDFDKLPPIGREPECSLFRKHWDSGRGGVLILEGPPGIGKSRLIRAFSAHVCSDGSSGDPGRIRILECLPQYSDIPYFPLIRLLRNLLGIPHGQEVTVSRERIGAYVKSLKLPDSRRAEILLGDLLGLPPSPGPLTRKTRNRTDSSKREETEKTLLAILLIRGRLLLVVEDLQWADDSTRHFLRKVLEDPILSKSLLTVVSVRTGKRPPWTDHLPDAKVLPLFPLSDEDSRAMAQTLTGKRALAESVVVDLVHTTGGVPLFLEETVRMILETPGPGGPLPRTVDELFSDQLSRNPKDRPLFQRAAVIGRVVPTDLFRAVSTEPQEFLDGFLRRGVRSGLLRLKSDHSGEFFEFCHVLFQEAAARSLSTAERMRLHVRIGETMIGVFPQRAELTPELLAVHFEKGGRGDLAASWYETAARRSFGRGAFIEAERQARAALRLLRSMPAKGRNPDLSEARLLLFLGAIRTETWGLGRPDVGRIFQEAVTMTGTVKIFSEESFHSIFGHFHVLLASGALKEAENLERVLSKMATKGRSPDIQEKARFASGQLLFHRGHFSESLEVLSTPDRDREVDSPTGFGRQIACYRAWTLWYSGCFSQSRQELSKIESWAKERDSPLRGFYLTMACMIYRNFGKVDWVFKKTEEILETADYQKTVAWLPSGMGLRGWALSQIGQPEGTDLVLKSIPLARKTHRVAESLFLSLLAEAYLAEGDGRRAREVVKSALRFSFKTGIGLFNAELFRLRGECSLLLGDDSNAEKDFENALEVAKGQGARALALRATVSLATLLCGQGSPGRVRPLLEPFDDLIKNGDPWVPELRKAKDLWTACEKGE